MKGALDAVQASEKLLREVFNPVVDSKNTWMFQDSQTENGSTLIAKAQMGKSNILGNSHTLKSVDNILTFLSDALTGFTSCNNPNTPFFTQIGKNIYLKISQLIIQYVLQDLIPKNYKELTDFPVQIAIQFIDFENKWIERKFLNSKEAYLTEYCSNIQSISLKSWREKILEEAREIITLNQYDYEIVEPKVSDINLGLNCSFCNH